MADYILTLFSSVLAGQGFLEDITPVAKDWERSIRWNGGPWLGSFRVEAELPVLMEWFNNRLGDHVEERSGGALTWSGLIYDMELASGMVKQWRSLDNMFNAVRARYSASTGGTADTDWITNAASIARYGRKENVLGETYVSTQNAEQIADMHLAENAYPWPRANGIHLGDADKPSLTVGVAGYAYTANWRFISDEWDDESDITVTTTIHDWLVAVLGDTSRLPFLTLATVEANTNSVQQYQGTPIRVWDFVQNLIKRGDGGNIPWRIWVTPQRTVNAGRIDLTPYYFLQGGKLTDANSAPLALTPYQVTPGVVRNLEYPMATIEPGSILSDGRDVLVQETAVDVEGRLVLRTTEASREDVFSEHSLRWREMMMRWIAYEAGQAAAQAQRDQEAWEADYLKRKAAWEALYPGIPFPG